MSPSPSPTRDIVDTYSRRRIPRIPSDQQKLLEESNSWAAELKNQPHGLAHVPGHVLKTVKEAYANREKLATNSSQPKRKTRSPSASPSRKRVREGDGADSQRSGTPISWASSPARDPLPERRVLEHTVVVQSSIVLETPQGARLPKSPLLVCPSSDAPEEDLEMEEPQPLNQINEMPAVAREPAPSQSIVDSTIPSANQTIATPPCGQPSRPARPVASTSNTNGDTPTNNVHGERHDQERVRFKSIPFDHSGKKIQQPPNRLAATKIFPPAFSSIPTSSSSIIVATQNGSSTQESIIRSIEGDEDPREPTTITATAQSVVEEVVAEEDSLDSSSSSSDEPVHTPVHRKSATAVQSDAFPRQQSSQHEEPAKSQSGTVPQIGWNKLGLKPYEVFKWHYPHYQDSSVDFVKACLCLRYLSDRKLLRECLFDEFIGVFGRYMEYAQQSEPGRTTLVALEWFNIQQPDPTFTSRVVGRNDIEEILRKYPEEVSEATRMIVDRSGSISEESSRGSAYHENQPNSAQPGQSQAAGRPEPLSLDGAMETEGVVPRSPAEPSYELPQMRGIHHENQQVTVRKPTQTLPSSAKQPPPVSTRRRPIYLSTQSAKPRPTPYSSRVTPQSSRAPAFLTQAPPPSSPRIPKSTAVIPKSTAVIPATIATPNASMKPPRRSQYSARLGSNSASKSRPAIRTAEERERLREHFKKRKSMDRNSITRSSQVS